MYLVSVKDQKGLYRDLNTNAIINKNNMEYENYIKQRNIRKSKDTRIDTIEDKITNLQNDISMIKDILSNIVEKI